MKKKIKEIKVIKYIEAGSWHYSEGYTLVQFDNQWNFRGGMYDAQYFIDRPEWFKVNYEDEQPERVRQMFEDEQPKKVKKILEIEYDQPYWDFISTTFEEHLKAELIKWNIFKDKNLSVRKLQTTKSKDELIQQINSIGGFMANDLTEYVMKKQAIDLINSHYPEPQTRSKEELIKKLTDAIWKKGYSYNWYGLKNIIDSHLSHYPDSDGWSDGEVIDILKLFHNSDYTYENCLNKFKNSKGKNERTDKKRIISKIS